MNFVRMQFGTFKSGSGNTENGHGNESGICVEIHFETEEKHLKFDEDEENAIYRVIQESITNAVRHGHAKKIWITLKKIDGEILLVIKDNGIGCEEVKSGFGTKHIKERIEMLKGTVSFDGRNGFTVTARIPIRWGETYD